MNMRDAYQTYCGKLVPVARVGAPNVYSHDQVGFTAPARIWAKVDDIERSAASLDRDIDANVREPGFVAGWKTWYQNWRRTYYEPYRSPTADSIRRRLGALVGSDELDAAVERERRVLHDWYESYTRQRLPNGQPVPFPSGLPPVALGQTDTQAQSAWSLPWWFWLAAGGAVAFIAWRFYVTYKMVGARGRAIEDKLIPALAERSGLPGQETREVLQAGRDSKRRDPPGILDLAYYVQGDGSGSASREGWSGGETRALRSAAHFEMSEDEEDDHPNFAYDPSRDPLYDRFR